MHPMSGRPNSSTQIFNDYSDLSACPRVEGASDQLAIPRHHRGMGPVFGFQFSAHGLDMQLDRDLLQAEIPGDFLVGFARTYAPQNIQLTRAQQGVIARTGRVQRGKNLARQHRSDRRNHRPRSQSFRHHPARAHDQGGRRHIGRNRP